MKNYYIFNLKGEIPSKKNSIKFSKYGEYKTARYKNWHKDALLQILPQVVKNGITEPLSAKYKISLFLTHGDKRRRDADNATSSIFDLLQDAQIINDDNYNILDNIHIYNRYIKNDPAAVILIEKIEETINFDLLINNIINA